MRISDAVQFSKDTVKNGQVILMTQKNGKRVSIPLHKDAQEALKVIDLGNHYYFWSGNGTAKSALASWARTMKRLSQITEFKVTAHRFRHTLIVKLLSNGIPISEVAAIAGNSPRIIERQYNQWWTNRQDKINESLKSIWA
jgi:integrase